MKAKILFPSETTPNARGETVVNLLEINGFRPDFSVRAKLFTGAMQMSSADMKVVLEAMVTRKRYDLKISEIVGYPAPQTASKF